MPFVALYSVSAATDSYNTAQEFIDPKHGEGDPLSIEQRAIVERYLATYSKIQQKLAVRGRKSRAKSFERGDPGSRQ
jgi:hypothetical protein